MVQRFLRRGHVYFAENVYERHKLKRFSNIHHSASEFLSHVIGRNTTPVYNESMTVFIAQLSSENIGNITERKICETREFLKYLRFFFFF